MFSVKEIASLIGGSIIGDPNYTIKGVCDLEKGKKGFITYVKDSSYNKFLIKSKASVVLIKNKFEFNKSKKIFIIVDNPGLAFVSILELIKYKTIINHKKNSINIKGKNIKIGDNVSISNNVNIGKNVFIGNDSIIHPGVYIGDGAYIGKETTIFPNVVLYDHVTIGNNCKIDSGSIIGADGFGLIKDKNKNINIPHVGKVVIGNNVTIGSNCCIDRGTINDTIIKDDCKFDNLIQIGHNVVIGKGCILAAQVGIAGSTTLGDYVTVAGQTGIIDHITVGNNSVIAAKSLVCHSLNENSFVSGIPANIHKDVLKQYAAIKKLPKILKKISNDR